MLPDGVSSQSATAFQNLTFRQFVKFTSHRLHLDPNCGRYLEEMDYTGCRPFTDREYEKMLSTFSGKYALRDIALFEFGIRTGFRISEILSIRVGDVFRDGIMANSVTVKRSWMKGRHNSRTMPLHPLAAERISEWMSEAGFNKPEMAEQPVFCRQLTGHPMSRAQAWTILKDAARLAGLDVERVGSHSLRKTFARKMWESPRVGGDMAKMAKLLGHRNYNNTLRYLEFLDGSLESAVMAS